MKKLLSVFAFATLVAACNQAPKEEPKPAAEEGKKESAAVTYAYPMNYSADFSMGDPKLAQTIAQLWKEFDNNTFQSTRANFADSVTMEFPDGTKFVGTGDSAIAYSSQWRSSIPGVKSSIDAIMSVKENKSGDRWVLVWGKEVDSLKGGKKDSTLLHEIWRFNKDEKIDYWHQWTSKEVKAK